MFSFALVFLFAGVLGSEALAARLKTGILEKKEVDGEKIMIFTDTTYGYSLTTPEGWEFKAQKDKKKLKDRNPYRVHARLKDKQLPTQLWESPSAVTPAQILIFIFDSEMDAEEIRDSLASPTSNGDWQKPIIKHCDILYDSDFLNKMDIRWGGMWTGSAYSVKRDYTAQIPSGSGFGSVSEVVFGEFYVFPFREHKMLVHLLSEREFLQENRETVKSVLMQISDPEE